MRGDLPARLKDLLSEELGLYRSLRALVSRELEAIVLNEDMEELLNILQEKDAVISRLQLLVDSWQDALSDSGLRGTRGADDFWEQLLASLPEAHFGELSISIFKSSSKVGIIQGRERTISNMKCFALSAQ